MRCYGRDAVQSAPDEGGGSHDKEQKEKETAAFVGRVEHADDFLKEQGTFEEFQSIAIKEVQAWLAAEAMKGK
jgi:hypothetical protein